MPLIECSDQNSQTLEQFYTEGDNEVTLRSGAKMLSLIRLLDANFIDTQLFGLTSIYRLNILAEDTWKSPWYVTFASDGHIFRVEYSVSKSKQPWPNARMHGETESIEQAFKMILIAMSESEGWQGNAELEKLLKAYSH